MNQQFILLVEDDPNDQELIIRALWQSGIDSEIILARDGAEAVELLFGGKSPLGNGHHPRMPALVLLDLSLPRLSGLAVLRRVRANRLTRHLPVVVVTGAWHPEQILAGFRLQADGFVCKAMDFKKLSEALGNMALEVLLGGHERFAGNDGARNSAMARVASGTGNNLTAGSPFDFDPADQAREKP